MKARTVDDKRRLVMPEGCPPHSRVVIEELDRTTWLVRRHIPSRNYKMVLIPAVERLPDDPEWEKVEHAFARRAAKTLSEPEP